MPPIKSSPRKLALIIASLVVTLLLGGALAFVLFRKPDPFVGLPAFPIEAYMEGKALWSHEDYKVEGRVDNVIARSASGEKFLVSIQPTGSSLRLPICLTSPGGKVPVQREQNVRLKVSLGPASQILCKEFAQK